MNGREKIGHWLKNVFVYHYGRIVLLAAAAAALVIWLTVGALRRERYDLNAVIASQGPVSAAETAALERLIAEAAGDLNDDGTIKVNIRLVDLSDAEGAETEYTRMLLFQSLPEYTLFFIEGEQAEKYCQEEESFRDLTEFGIAADEKYPNRVYVGDSPAMFFSRKREYYALLSDWTDEGKGSAEATAAIVRAIKALLSGER